MNTWRKIVVLIRLRTRRFDREFKTLLENSSWMVLSNAIQTPISFLRAIVIARGLGVEGYGTYVLIVAFATTVTEFFDLNFGSAVIKFGADFRTDGRPDRLVALIKVSLVVLTGLALLSVAAAWVLAAFSYERLIGAPGLRVLLFCYVAATSFRLLDSMSMALLRLVNKFRINSILNVTFAVMQLILMAIVLWLYPGQLVPFLIAAITAEVLTGIVTNGVAVSELWPQFRDHIGAPMQALSAQRKELTMFVLSNSGTKTLRSLMNSGDVLLLGFLASPLQVAFYEIGRRVAFSIARLTGPMSMSIYPQTSRLIAERRFDELLELLRRSTIFLGVPACFFFALIFVFGRTGIIVLYGEEFAPAAGPLYMHLFAALAFAVIFWEAPVLLSLGKTGFRFVLTATAVVMGAAAAIALAPRFGATGVAIGSAGAKLLVIGVSAAVALKALRSAARPDAVSAPPSSVVVRQR